MVLFLGCCVAVCTRHSPVCATRCIIVQDSGYLQMAFEEAERAYAVSEVPVGAVVVHNTVSYCASTQYAYITRVQCSMLRSLLCSVQVLPLHCQFARLYVI